MSSGQLRKKHPQNKTVIRDGFIVRLRKDGRVKTIIDTWPPKKK